MQLLTFAVVISLLAGVGSGYLLANRKLGATPLAANNQAPNAAQQDTKTFRDFAEGVIEKKPEPKDPTEYSEGTHLLRREKALPVALTSSVVDLSLYEGKKVKVYGETQKAIKEGWLMDVGRVQEE